MYTIGKIAKLAGVSTKTLRHYEKIGLILPSDRTELGYRLYTEKDVETLKKIKFYQEMSFSLSDIGHLLESSPEVLKDAIEKQIRLVQKSAKNYEKIEGMLLRSCGGEDKVRPCTAILVIGMQRDFVSGPLGNRQVKKVIKPLQELLEKAREKGHVIVYVCDCHIKGVHEELNIWGDHALKGSPGAEVIDELAPQTGDQIVHKSYFNGFYQSELHSLLRELDVGTLIVGGLHAHMCVAETIINAHHLGYKIIVPEDCVISFKASQRQFALRLFNDSYAIETPPLSEVLQNL
jgi:nicotinamidase-related amidase